MSRPFLPAFLAGVACGLALAWVGGSLLSSSSDSISDVAAASEVKAAPSALALDVLSARPSPPPGASAEAVSTDAQEEAFEREPEGEPTSAIISTALFQEVRERAERVRDALEDVPGGEAAPIAYQLETYQKALADNLNNLPLPDGPEKKAMILEAFLWSDSVQTQLANMTSTSRQSELSFIRRELGYNDDEVKALAQRDVQREMRWQNGLAYTKERYRIAGNLEGAALQKELDRLRQKHFGAEAGTIAAEERDGFFRYERPRIYGRN